MSLYYKPNLEIWWS